MLLNISLEMLNFYNCISLLKSSIIHIVIHGRSRSYRKSARAIHQLRQSTFDQLPFQLIVLRNYCDELARYKVQVSQFFFSFLIYTFISIEAS